MILYTLMHILPLSQNVAWSTYAAAGRSPGWRNTPLSSIPLPVFACHFLPGQWFWIVTTDFQPIMTKNLLLQVLHNICHKNSVASSTVSAATWESLASAFNRSRYSAVLNSSSSRGLFANGSPQVSRVTAPSSPSALRSCPMHVDRFTMAKTQMLCKTLPLVKDCPHAWRQWTTKFGWFWWTLTTWLTREELEIARKLHIEQEAMMLSGNSYTFQCDSHSYSTANEKHELLKRLYTCCSQTKQASTWILRLWQHRMSCFPMWSEPHF